MVRVDKRNLQLWMDAVVPEIFRNCISKYHIKDIQYVRCPMPSDADPCQLLKELHEAKDIRKYLFATIVLILATIAISVNITYGALVVELWRQKKLSSLCRYIFLMSRTISSILALILLYIVVMAWKIEILWYTSAAAFILIGSLSFLALAGTYVAKTTLLYLAIVHPFRYRHTVNATRCFIVVAIIWIISVAFSLFLGLYGATLFYPERSPVFCSFHRCQQPIAIFVTLLFSAFFITVIAFYLIMLYFVRNRIQNDQLVTTAEERSNVRTMNRLALNTVTFTAGSLPILIVIAIATINLEHLAILGIGDKSSCKTFLHGKYFYQIEILASVAATVWILAMMFDPIINLIADPKSIDSLRSLRCCLRKREISCTEFHSPTDIAIISMRNK